MSYANREENNLRKKSGLNQYQVSNRNDAELGKFSAAENVRVEKAWPTPVYDFVRAVTFASLTSADTSGPNTAAPTGNSLWNLRGFSGLAGYVAFSGGTSPTVDLELWLLDEVNKVWLKAASVTGVTDKEQFVFDEKVRSHKCFLRVTGSSGSPTSADIRCTGQ